MMSTLRRASLALATLLLAGCDPEARLLGSWELATIDGVGPAVAAPLRVILPAGVFGADSVAADGMWHEVTLAELALTLEPEGTFRERVVEAKRTLVRQNTFERPDYVSGAFGGDLIRADAEPSPSETTGSWTLTGDSLVLDTPRPRAAGASRGARGRDPRGGGARAPERARPAVDRRRAGRPSGALRRAGARVRLPPAVGNLSPA
jgi:hypothetical protein